MCRYIFITLSYKQYNCLAHKSIWPFAIENFYTYNNNNNIYLDFDPQGTTESTWFTKISTTTRPSASRSYRALHVGLTLKNYFTCIGSLSRRLYLSQTTSYFYVHIYLRIYIYISRTLRITFSTFIGTLRFNKHILMNIAHSQHEQDRVEIS